MISSYYSNNIRNNMKAAFPKRSKSKKVEPRKSKKNVSPLFLAVYVVFNFLDM